MQHPWDECYFPFDEIKHKDGNGLGTTIGRLHFSRRIDYTFIRGLDVRQATVLNVDASDHLPLKVIFARSRDRQDTGSLGRSVEISSLVSE